MRSVKRWPLLAFALWAAGLLLVIWALRSIPLGAVRSTLIQLSLWQVAVLAAVNAAVLVVFGARWWLLIRALGARRRLLTILAYRLAAFGVNYFTPGPQFGAEPLQVAVLHTRQKISGPEAATSVVLDKLLELAVNLGFLVWGLALVLSQGLFTALEPASLLAFALALLALPMLYLAALWSGLRPLTRLLAFPSSRLGRLAAVSRLEGFVTAAEARAGAFCREQPRVFAAAALLSFGGWLLMILELWLTLFFLGLPATLTQAFIILTAARVAFLAPTPGGLGALEAALVLATTTLGFGPAAGISLALLVRARDFLLGAAGLALAGRLMPRARTAEDIVV